MSPSLSDIPRKIREQEQEIESIFWNLIRFREGAVTEARPRGSGFPTERTTEMEEQRVGLGY